MAGGDEESSTSLEYTPTWVVAAVCSIIVIISLALERILHLLGKYLRKTSPSDALLTCLRNWSMLSNLKLLV